MRSEYEYSDRTLPPLFPPIPFQLIQRQRMTSTSPFKLSCQLPDHSGDVIISNQLSSSVSPSDPLTYTHTHLLTPSLTPSSPLKVRSISTLQLPSGTDLILSGSRDQTAKLWARKAGERDFGIVETLGGNGGFVNSTAFLQTQGQGKDINLLILLHFSSFGSRELSKDLYPLIPPSPPPPPNQ